MRYRLPPQTALEKLKLAATFLSLKKGLRYSGMWGVGWGLFTVGVGFLARPSSLLDYAWFAIGLFVLMQGVWILRAPSIVPRMIVSESIALLALGLWNTVGMYLIVQSGGRPILGGHAFIWGIAQLLSAYSTYKGYPGLKLVLQNLDPASADELENASRGAWKLKSSESPDTVELKTAGFLDSGQKLKIKSMPEYLILLAEKGRKTSVYGKDEIEATQLSEKRFSKHLNLTLRMDDEEYKAELEAPDLERLRAWVPSAFQGVPRQFPKDAG